MNDAQAQIDKQIAAGHVVVTTYLVSRKAGGRKIEVTKQGLVDLDLVGDIKGHFAQNNKVINQKPEFWADFYAGIENEVKSVDTNNIALLKVCEKNGTRMDFINYVFVRNGETENFDKKGFFIKNESLAKMNTQEKGQALC